MKWDQFLTIRKRPFSSKRILRTITESIFDTDKTLDRLFFVTERSNDHNNFHTHILTSSPKQSTTTKTLLKLKGLDVWDEPVKDNEGVSIYLSKWIGQPNVTDYDLLIRED